MNLRAHEGSEMESDQSAQHVLFISLLNKQAHLLTLTVLK